MKFAFLLCCFVFIIGSCKKDAGIQPAPIAGTWVWWKNTYALPLSATNPLTPQNSGITELMYFTLNGDWRIVRNGSTIDSGTYSLGHGSYLPYVGAYHYIYDSIGFYRAGNFLGWDSYKISNDSLVFSPGLSGRFSSYLSPYNGSRFYTKQY
ncbi:MAG: hypothetical protein Q8K64_01185 [Sediminibacterium sp.]|nr:hypothetical protein [Sediminibacterium sp.]